MKRLICACVFSAVVLLAFGCEMTSDVITPAMPSEMLMHSIPVWMELPIGELTKEVLVTEIESRGYSITLGAQAILDSPAFSMQEQKTLKLFSVLAADIGVSDSASYADVIGMAREFGLAPCPASVGPYLRRIPKDQMPYENLYIAMEPIMTEAVGDLDSGPRIFWLSPSKLASRDTNEMVHWIAGTILCFVNLMCRCSLILLWYGI